MKRISRVEALEISKQVIEQAEFERLSKKMTKEEFEKKYADASNLTIERLHELGLFAAPCDCDYENCQGWQMVTLTHVLNNQKETHIDE